MVTCAACGSSVVSVSMFFTVVVVVVGAASRADSKVKVTSILRIIHKFLTTNTLKIYSHSLMNDTYNFLQGYKLQNEIFVLSEDNV